MILEDFLKLMEGQDEYFAIVNEFHQGVFDGDLSELLEEFNSEELKQILKSEIKRWYMEFEDCVKPCVTFVIEWETEYGVM